MANTIINPKPAHLSGDSAKFHSKVGGKSHKGRKTHKTHKGRKSMKSKKSRKTMRKTMGKKSGGGMGKGLMNILGARPKSGLTQTQKQCKKKVELEKEKNCKGVETLYRDKCNEKIRKDKWIQYALKKIKGEAYTRPRTRSEQITEEGEHCADLSNVDRKKLQYDAIQENLNCTEKYDNESKNCEKQ